MFIRGSQFGAFTFATIWFFVAFVIEERKFNLRWSLLLIALLFVPYTIKVFSFDDITFFYQRVILQGHVFWGTINLLIQNGPNPDYSGFAKNYNDFFSGFQMGNIEYGFGKLMADVSPQFAEMYLKAGVRFTAGYPAILIYHFGPVAGILFHLLFTYIYFYAIQYIVYCFKYRDVIFSYIIYLMFMIYSDFMIMGEYAHFRVKFLIKVIIVLLTIFIYKNYSKKKQNNVKPETLISKIIYPQKNKHKELIFFNINHFKK